jgi:hypothetical protein
VVALGRRGHARRGAKQKVLRTRREREIFEVGLMQGLVLRSFLDTIAAALGGILTPKEHHNGNGPGHPAGEQ